MSAPLYDFFAAVRDAAREYVRENMSEEATQIHENRNHTQENLTLDEPPPDTPYFDPNTGMTWERDNLVGEYIYHNGNDCYDAAVTSEIHHDLISSPDYLHEVDTLRDALHLTDIDPHAIVPGPQVCFDPDTGERVDSGPGAGTWNYASPLVPGQSDEHMALDMAPHLASDQYNAYPSPAEHDTHWEQPPDNAAGHQDHWDNGSYGDDGSGDGY